MSAVFQKNSSCKQTAVNRRAVASFAFSELGGEKNKNKTITRRHHTIGEVQKETSYSSMMLNFAVYTNEPKTLCVNFTDMSPPSISNEASDYK